MLVGVPREVKNHEYRVAITPAGVHELVRHGHQVFVADAGGHGLVDPDADYTAAGAQILGSADDVWAAGDLILKVKEPIAAEYPRLREGQTLFTYLHLAADKALTEELMAAGSPGSPTKPSSCPTDRCPARPDERGGRAARARRWGRTP